MSLQTATKIPILQSSCIGRPRKSRNSASIYSMTRSIVRTFWPCRRTGEVQPRLARSRRSELRTDRVRRARGVADRYQELGLGQDVPTTHSATGDDSEAWRQRALVAFNTKLLVGENSLSIGCAQRSQVDCCPKLFWDCSYRAKA